MALNYDVQAPRVGQAFQQGRLGYHQLQAAREQTDAAPLRRRMQELGIQQTEQGLRAGEQIAQQRDIDINNAEIRKYIGDAYQLSQIKDPVEKAKQARALAQSYFDSPSKMDDEAGANLLAYVQQGPEALDQAIGAVVQRGMSEGILQDPRAVGKRSSVPSAIQEFEYYQSLPQEARDLYDRVQRGDQLSAGEKANLAYETEKAKQRAITEAEQQRYNTEGTAEYSKRQAAEAEQAMADRKYRDQLRSLDVTIGSLEQTMEQTSDSTTGLSQSVLKFVPGTENYDFEAMAQNVMGRIALDTMERLKSQSAQGATGFGQLSNKELELLQNSITSLQTSQSLDQFKRNLQRVIDIYKDDYATIRLEKIPVAEDPETRWDQMKMLGMSDRRARMLMLAEGKTPPEEEVNEFEGFEIVE